jgi:3-hydroxyisobutyrate dehydrogenase-like beta-hydroxyacid dehydrogenase
VAKQSSGRRAAYEAHLPAFKAIGAEVFHMGPLGSASAIKVAVAPWVSPHVWHLQT